MATPEQWPKIKEIVGAALEREPSERSAFLDQACSQDRELRAEVESCLLLTLTLVDCPSILGGEHSGRALRRIQNNWALPADPRVGCWRDGTGVARRADLAGTPPSRPEIDRARNVRRCGRRRRFQSERQSLAIMDHPTIAKVFDAGATPAGQPYFVMEYVDGLPITEYCDRKKAGHSRAPETVHPGLRRSTACPPESHHSIAT